MSRKEAVDEWITMSPGSRREVLGEDLSFSDYLLDEIVFLRGRLEAYEKRQALVERAAGLPAEKSAALSRRVP
jgi:hypothetical protein